MEEKNLTTTGDLEINLEQVREGLNKIKQFQAVVKELTKEGSDYGVIPGTEKPTLLKPGAEKIAKLMNLSDSYEIMDKREDYKEPLFAYTIRCSLKNIKSGNLISEGIGQCNSLESKYRYRWIFDNDIPKGMSKETLKSKKIFSKKKQREYNLYRINNDEIFSQINTVLKMAKKRALVDAVLSAARLSEVFTQDLDETQTSKPSTASQPQPEAIQVKASKIELAARCKAKLGNDRYFKILGGFGVEKFEQLTLTDMDKVLDEFKNMLLEMKK